MALPDLSTSPFRQSAIDRLSSPEQLDEMVKIADAKGWVAALGIALLVTFAAIWGVFGAIPTEVMAPGILVLRGGYLMSVPSPASGVITELRVHAGDIVKKGEVVATVRQTELEQRLAEAKNQLKDRQDVLAARREALKHEMVMQQRDAAVRRAAYHQASEATEEQIKRLRQQLTIREDLRRQHLTVEDRVEQTRTALASATERLSETRARTLELDSSLQNAALAQQRELQSLQDAVDEARRGLSQVQLRLQQSNVVVAPAAGRVTEVTTTLGSTVVPGSSIVNIETPGKGLEATVYVPIASGKKVVPGMRVRVEPSTVRREDFGTMLGRVLDVSSFPSTPAGMHAVLQNQTLVAAFSGAAPPYEARIDLQRADTPSGYAWTSGAGPHIDLTSGTTVKAYIAVESDPPIVLLLPFLHPLFANH